MATLSTLINKFGTMAGWNSAKANMLGRDIEGIIQLSYDDKVDKKNVYGAGNMPIGRGIGNYEAKASITLLKEELIGLQATLGPGKRIQDIAPFDITVQYEYSGFLYKDRIRNCEFMNNGVDVKNNDGSISTKIDLIVSHIEWNTI